MKYKLPQIVKASAIHLVVSLWGLVTCIFILSEYAPGGPYELIAEDHLKSIKDDIVPQTSIGIRYLTLLISLLQGDLGESTSHPDVYVTELIHSGLETSVILILAGAMWCAVSINILLHVWMHGSQRQINTIGHLIFILGTIPGYVTAPIMVWLLGMNTFVEDTLRFAVASLVMVLCPLAQITRLIRYKINQIAEKPYIKMALMKGLTKQQCMERHILPLAKLMIMRFLPTLSASLLTSSVVVEKLFLLPGIGRLFIDAALQRDYALLTGIACLYMIALQILTIVTDCCIRLKDRRDDPLQRFEKELIDET